MNEAVLLVEDNPDDETLILRALRKVNLGNQVHVVRDGQQALDYLFVQGEFADRQHPRPPAVVLLDINLPRLSGLQVLQRLRADTRTHLLPIVMLTSSDDERDLLRSYEDGCNSFVRKPLDFNEFALAVGTLGLYWTVTNHKPPPLPAA